MEKDSGNSYKTALKATSLFGGVQIYNIAIRIIRSKVVAVLLGPEGMGIYGLLSSSTTLVSSITSCGLGQSSIKNIAEANASGDNNRIAIVISVLRKLVWITGLVGSVVCAALSPYLSQITFGNKDYTIAFICISISILLMQLTAGQNALLQGLQKYRGLAKSNVYGSAVGLLITLPLYYIWRIDAIVPVFIISYVISFLCAYRIAKKVEIPKLKSDSKQMREVGLDMLKLGLLLSAQGVLSQLTAYLVRVYIRQDGSIEDVGLYNAGFAFVNTYIGMIFTAMSTDYYPRLTKAAKDSEQYFKTITQQVELVLLIILPLIVAFLLFVRLIVVLLYSNKFLPVEGMIYWTMAAMTVRSLAWSLSYGLIAKGYMKSFAICEFSVIVYGFIFNIIGYKYGGLTGIGISYFMMYVVYFLHLFVVFKSKTGFVYPYIVWKFFSISAVVIALVIGVKLFLNDWLSYSLGTIIMIVTLVYSFKEIDKRVQIKEIIRRKISK